MYYSIDTSALLEKVKAEVSEVADQAYAEDGTSLYDSIAVTAKDHDAIEGWIMDAANNLVRVMRFVASPATGSSAPGIVFDVPDMPQANADAAADRLDRYISLYAATKLFQQRRPSVVETYQNDTAEAMASAMTLLLERTAPSRT